jgi:predicted CXXCH cytochrome family protein
MNRISGASLRPHSPWLALLLSAIILIFSVTLTVFMSSGQAEVGAPLPNSESLGSVAPGFRGPQQCAECHPAQFHDWADTIHAKASFDPIFQDFLQEASEPGECFACHATGYNAATGQFVMAGVTCEACHGPYRATHPGQSMQIATSQEMCGACHQSTLAEWQISQHGQAGIACVACHEVHTQRTRVTASTDALCAGCHQQGTQDAMHQAHRREDIPCIACHLSRPADKASQAVSGHAATGHSFVADRAICTECHQDQP